MAVRRQHCSAIEPALDIDDRHDERRRKIQTFRLAVNVIQDGGAFAVVFYDAPQLRIHRCMPHLLFELVFETTIRFERLLQKFPELRILLAIGENGCGQPEQEKHAESAKRVNHSELLQPDLGAILRCVVLRILGGAD